MARWRLPLYLIAGILSAYFVAAYVILPQIDERKERRHPDLRDAERLTHTHTGLPGDPLNIALVGSEEDVVRALLTAGWRPADPLSFRSSVRIAVDTVIDKPDPDAPVSNLYLYGRREDLAYEKPIGHSPRERHHVRFWKTDKLDEGRVVWIGSAAFDIGVELSRTTGEVTHHIAPDVDAERDLLIADLTKSGRVEKLRWVNGFHQELQGRNGGGDPWRTNGRMAVAMLSPAKH